jgi:hypothetical protein
MDWARQQGAEQVRFMDHNYAVKNHTAERYLMDELEEAERNAYEEHFFSCPACAEEIRSGSRFMEIARSIVQEEGKAPFADKKHRAFTWGRWLNWKSLLQPMPVMACALLVLTAGFAVYQNKVVIPRLAEKLVHSQATASAQLVDPNPFRIVESRGVQNSRTFSKDKAFTLQYDIVDTGFKFYEVEITDESNVARLSWTVAEKETANSLGFPVSAGALKTGKYFLVVRGVNSGDAENAAKGELVRIPFELKVQD